MIIVKLTGGIGNQLFQYYLGKNLSIKNKDELILDISEFNDKKRQLRTYGLSFFNIKVKVLSEKDLKYNDLKIIKEKSEFIFDPMVFNNKENIFLQGYWQNQKYFYEIKDIIKDEITLKKEFQFDISKKTDGMLKKENTVAVHIRRGDYIKNRMIRKMFNVCDVKYYNKAINKMAELLKNPTFLFFSDDINWVKKNIKTKFPYLFISGNRDYEDFIIMQNCKHNIISNSSFSWWAAWLNNNKNKIVVAPSQWINDNNINYSDLIPPGWIKIDNIKTYYILFPNMLQWLKNIFKR